MFNIGDLAVYPARGVGKIEAIKTQNISGAESKFYIFRIIDNGLTIMIPTKNACAVGLREIVCSRDVPLVYEILGKKEAPINGQPWNRRYREYTEKIKTGSVFEVAEVFRDLFLLKKGKDLSFGERKLLETARNLLTSELSIAQGKTAPQIENAIENILTR